MTGPELRTTLDSPELDPEGDTAVCEVDIGFSAAETPELPLHVVFCIDVSGSMGSDFDPDSPLSNAQRGAKQALDTLSGDDHFSVVAFANRGDTAIEPTPADRTGVSDGKDAIEKIKHNDTGGGTTIMQGVEESLRQFSRMPDEEAVEWIVFLTDGSDYGFDAAAGARDIDDRGVTAHPAGFGNYTQETLQTLAGETNGTWEHISEPSALPPWFEGLIQSARGVVATDPDLHIDPRGTTLERAFYTVGEEREPRDVPTTSGQSQVTADLGDLNAEDPPAVFLRFDVPETPPDETPLLLADLTLETRVGNATAAIEADLKPPIMQETEKRNPMVKRDYALGVAEREGLDDNTEEAKRVLQRVREDEELTDDEVLDDALAKVSEVEDSNHEDEQGEESADLKEARDNLKGGLGKVRD